MKLPPPWIMRLLGYGPRRERALAEASRADDRHLLERELAEDEDRFRARMDEIARGPHVVLGTSLTGVEYRVSFDDLVSLPVQVTSGTGGGKSRFVGGYMGEIIGRIARWCGS